jgi:hypothetical protein
MIDTGASHSICSEETARKLHSFISPLQPTQTQFLFGPNGNPLKILGKIDATVRMAGFNMKHTFLVIKDLSYPVLIGLDFLELSQANISFVTKTISFLNDLVTVPLISNEKRDTARSAKPVKIPANTEAILTVSFPRKYKQQLCILESVPTIVARHLFVARAII